MARPRKTAKKTTPKKSTSRGKSANARGNVKLHTLNKDQLSDHIKAQTAQIKMLKSTNERRQSSTILIRISVQYWNCLTTSRRI